MADIRTQILMETAVPGRASRLAWPGVSGLAWAGVGILVALLALIYGGILRDLVRDWWEDENYSHGFLVPVFSGYVVWQQRERLRGLVTDGSWYGVPVLLAGVAALILGDVGAELFVSRSSLIVLLAGLALFHLGWPVTRALAFPLAYLFFMVPLPGVVFFAVAFPLQRLAAENAAWVLDTIGVPVLLDGNIIQLSLVTLGVTEACSGIRSLISLLALAAAWAYLAVPGRWAGLLLVASAVPITILANAGRVVATGLVAQYVGPQYAFGFLHTFSGWVIFLVAVVGLVGVHGLLHAGRSWKRGSRP